MLLLIFDKYFIVIPFFQKILPLFVNKDTPQPTVHHVFVEV